ncbi:MAG: glycosyltransferase family 39 protein [Candidatus Levybacteria bacterium]|nr:glycosyltransferase family 39 protein [Candidatus Levybacteria bacterium]
MRSILPILVIFVIAGFLRFYQLGQNPPSLTWDEASWGYNAYSLLRTGKDEFGRFLPLDYLESFGDFKPPVYAYLTILPVAFFGLNEFATRFASAFFGTLTVLVTYHLVKRIFISSDSRERYALVSALFLALSPWHINLSRAAFEANVATFFLIAGIWLFLVGVQKNRWILLLSITSFVGSVYTFNTTRIIAPLLFLLLVISFRKNIFREMKVPIAGLFVGIALLLPTLPFLLSPQARLRFQEVNIFSDSGPVVTANQQIARNDNALWSKILQNRRIFYAREYIKHYFDNLSPSFLFIRGDGNPKFSTQHVGQLFLFDLPFLVLGILFLFRRREGNWYLLPLWFILGILPAGTARETPHALRIETVLPVPQIVIAYGLVQIASIASRLRYMKQAYIKVSVALALIVFLFLNVSYYLHDYYTHYPRTFSREWQYGYADAFSYIQVNESLYDRIYFTTDLGRPYIYYIFSSKLDPSQFQKTASIKRDSFGFVNVERVGKYYFQPNLPGSDASMGKVLFVNSPAKVPKYASVVKTFSLLNGEPSLVAYTL